MGQQSPCMEEKEVSPLIVFSIICAVLMIGFILAVAAIRDDLKARDERVIH